MSSEHIRQNIVYTNVTMHRKQNISDQIMFSMYVIAINWKERKQHMKHIEKKRHHIAAFFERNSPFYCDKFSIRLQKIQRFSENMLTTAHEIRPPTRDRQARYTL